MIRNGTRIETRSRLRPGCGTRPLSFARTASYVPLNMDLQEPRSMRASPRRMTARHVGGDDLGDLLFRVRLEADLQRLVGVSPRDDHEQPARFARIRQMFLELAGARLNQR